MFYNAKLTACNEDKGDVSHKKYVQSIITMHNGVAQKGLHGHLVNLANFLCFQEHENMFYDVYNIVPPLQY